MSDLPAVMRLEQIVALARERLLQANQRLRAEAERCDFAHIGATIAALFAADRPAPACGSATAASTCTVRGACHN